MPLAAAHALLKVVVAFLEGIFDDGHHRVVELRHQAVAGGQEDLSLVGLGPGLVEAFAQIVAIKADEVDNGLRCDPSGLALLQIEYKAGVSRKFALPKQFIGHSRLPRWLISDGAEFRTPGVHRFVRDSGRSET